MEQLCIVVNKLVDQERCYGENLSEIQEPIINYLVTYIQDNPNIDHVSLKEHLESLIATFSDQTYNYNTEEMIVSAREETVDEQKLQEKGVIISADQAREIADKFNTEKDELRCSGLSELKIRAMDAIRQSFAIGEPADLYINNVDGYDDYNREMELIHWLKGLGYQVKITNRGRYRIS